MHEAQSGEQPVKEAIADIPQAEEDQIFPYTWSGEYMDWRLQRLRIDRDRDYPRFSTEYYRRRWHWEAGEKEGDAAFAATALVAALKANRSQRQSSSVVRARLNQKISRESE